MIYIIDHQDSFTWNVVHQFADFENVSYYRLQKKDCTKQQLLKKIKQNLQS